VVLQWRGRRGQAFWEYLDICAKRQPGVVRNAYQRLYDAILAHGSEKYKLFKKECVRYHFFSDPFDNGADAIFGLDFALMQLVDFLRSAAEGYGTDKRILLLHGPVGSQQVHDRAPAEEGHRALQPHRRGCAVLVLVAARRALRGLARSGDREAAKTHEFPARCTRSRWCWCPREAREDLLASSTRRSSPSTTAAAPVPGEPDPFCRKMLEDLMRFYDGDWKKSWSTCASAASC
jgi:serine protein kinase